MKRNIYIVLCVVSIGLLGYTAYYAMSHKSAPPVATTEVIPPVATTTQPVIEEKNSFTTKSGKKIKVIETNPSGESLSTLTITTSGFATNSPLVLETNKLTDVSFIDLNSDSHEELILTTVSQGSGSFGEVFIYTTASTTMILPVTIPEMTEDDTKKGALLEGYMGHDTFSVIDGRLTRTFPTYKKTDTNSEPTGPVKRIVYTILEKSGQYTAMLSATTTQVTTNNSTSTATSTTR